MVGWLVSSLDEEEEGEGANVVEELVLEVTKVVLEEEKEEKEEEPTVILDVGSEVEWLEVGCMCFKYSAL